jgi:hypothetical protein
MAFLSGTQNGNRRTVRMRAEAAEFAHAVKLTRPPSTLSWSAKLNGVEPLAWLTDVLERVGFGRTKNHELAKLLPWAWKAAKDAQAARTGSRVGSTRSPNDEDLPR